MLPDTDDESICWNDSDSDKEDTGKQPDSHSSKPVKKPRLKVSTHRTQRKRKTGKVNRVKPEDLSHEFIKSTGTDSDSNDIISAEESDEEKPALAHAESPLALPSSSSKSASPVLQIEVGFSGNKLCTALEESSQPKK